MEAKEKEHIQKMQIMEKEYELKIKEHKQTGDQAIVNEAASDFMKLFVQDPNKAGKIFSDLNKLQDLFSK